ncbi:AAA family ATPase [Sphingobacterium sp. DN00404]|uniref:AAA family ATPase n=1 Tax=Sphingobacterium micropteri TaxID=2763501 RepID=A0ABR7YK15_9SPHI|nr:P-loop NTPase fold protein [Sphingobacterium micropteri]MBD1431599.1 AAA family ATPase [Sphingobacterium micropteri]
MGNSYQSSRGFVEDNAVEETKDDSYERTQVAGQIAKQIVTTDNKRAFAIGITGQYGSGKTSFINLICNTLKSEKSNPLVIHFNPWDANNSADIQKLFFDELSISLANEDRALSSSMYHYYRRLNGRSSFVGNIINNLRDLSLIFARDLDDEKRKINDMMNNLSRKVIMIIDDLDRLHNDEVIEVLRLIRNTANFSNIVYIVAYDKEYVEHSIKKLNERTYKNYLDKIFQIEIPLPKSESYLLSNSLVKSLEQIIKPKELAYVKDQFVRLNFDSEYEEAVSAIFKNHRDIVRFTNSFSIAYAMISEEVDFVQLLYIQILKYKYPLAFEMLYDRKHEVLVSSENSLSYEKSYTLRTISEKAKDDYNILELLKDKLNAYELTQVKYILNHLFSLELTLEYRNKTRTITNPEVFELFFTSRISSIGLSESEFIKNMRGNAKKIDRYVKNLLDQKKHRPLLHRILKMKLEDFVDRENYEEVVYAFVQKVAPIYIDKEGFRSLPFDGFIYVHISGSKAIIEKFYNGNPRDYSKHLSKMLSFHNESYLFISEVARKLIIQHGNSQIFPKKLVTKTQLECLIEGLDRNPTVVTPEVTWMFWGIREYHFFEDELGEINDQEIIWNIHPEAIEILKHRMHHKDLKYLLQSLISKDTHNDGKYNLHDKLIEDVFKNLFLLRETVQSNERTDNEIKGEFLNFLWKYEQAHETPIEYDFKHFEID